VLVGREAELTVLDTLVRQTAAGAGGVVLLAGEPGVSKTHLAGLSA
jgi:predicted ATPase